VRSKFEAAGSLDKDPYDLLKDELTYGYGTGPTRFGVKVKMPETAVYFMLKNDNDVESAKK
jgi:hypothetical protein